jgi:hypothetical protein
VLKASQMLQKNFPIRPKANCLKEICARVGFLLAMQMKEAREARENCSPAEVKPPAARRPTKRSLFE